MDAAIQYILYFAVLVVLAVPLGRFMAHIMDGEHTFLSPVIAPVERGVYRLLRIDAAEQMGRRRYLASVLVFSGIGLVILVALQALQSFLPGNPQHLPGVSWDLSFNTAASFITNTNWQSYSGETTLSYLVQFMGLTVQNFVSAGTGIAVMFALIRGFRQVKEQSLGSFWVDLTRTVLYVLIPLNLVFGICLAAGGVISNFRRQKAELVEPVAVQPMQTAAGASSTAPRVRATRSRSTARLRGRARGHRAVPAPGSRGSSGRHQAVRHQRRRLLRRELRPSV
ncbi:MAG: potassium-transporting ATPase subunit KdpA [Collinsella sp.]